MALTKDLTETKAGYTGTLVASDVYFKVTLVHGTKEEMAYEVTGTSEDGETMFVKTFSFVPSVSDDADNFIKQAYEHAKTLADFTGAVDA
jgi:hypothetical protein